MKPLRPVVAAVFPNRLGKDARHGKALVQREAAAFEMKG
jgi:hypothetical protein